jgi:hypothetical protein
MELDTEMKKVTAMVAAIEIKLMFNVYERKENDNSNRFKRWKNIDP